MKYRERPVVKEVEAIQYDGTAQSLETIVAFAGDWIYVDRDDSAGPIIRASGPRGPVQMAIGDWMVKGDHGDFFACKPGEFNRKYEPIE